MTPAPQGRLCHHYGEVGYVLGYDLGCEDAQVPVELVDDDGHGGYQDTGLHIG